MNHFEAQSYIMPFIDGKIPENKKGDFVMHMKNCKKCHDELEIYYTLLVGMKELDNKKSLSVDFSKDLENKLKQMEHKVRNRRSVKVSLFSIIMAFVILFVGLLYAGCLSEVYDFEQRTKLINQGDYYFSDKLDTLIIGDKLDRIENSKSYKTKKDITYFDRIRGYRSIEEDYDVMEKVGEDMLNVEATTD